MIGIPVSAVLQTDLKEKSLMKKKVISILLSGAMLSTALCAGVGAVTASADETYTYYFLAPDNYFKPEAGAANESVGAYWWEPSEPASWPGVEISPAFDIGENVFKIEGVSPETTNIIFNAFVDPGSPYDPEIITMAHQTVNINTEGYEEDEAYEGCPACDNFNGMIYVLDMHCNDYLAEYSGQQVYSGAWFTLDSYKDNQQFYGSYEFGKTVEKPTPRDTDTITTPEPENAKYRRGDKVTAVVTFGGLEINGAPAKLAAYNYDIIYNSAVADVVSCTDKTTGGSFVYNTGIENEVKLALMATYGVNEDFSGENAPAAVVVFEVTRNTDSLDIRGGCSSLSVVSMDAVDSKTAVGVRNPEDPYSQLIVDGKPIPNSEFHPNTPPTPDYEEPEAGLPNDYIVMNDAPAEPDAEVNDTDAAPKPSVDDVKTPTANSDKDKPSSNSNSSKVTSPKTGTNTASTLLPVVIVLFVSTAAAGLAKRRKE